MINLAKHNLKDINVNLQQGNIKKTTYQDNSFDLIKSTGSFYLWNHPEESLDEIYRILKPNRHVLFFDSHKEYNQEELKNSLTKNLQNENFFTKRMVPLFLKKQIKMTCSIKAVEDVIKNSIFRDNYSLNKITLANLPI